MHPYHGVTAALTTKHGKEKLIAPCLGDLSIEIEVVDFDTDLLGTFTGEVERSGNAYETALRKARAGMELSGLSYGIASEGSYGPDPQVPMLNSGIELLAWVDQERNFEIVESFRTFDIQAASKKVSEGVVLDELFSDCAFPSHAIIVRSEKSEEPLIFKGLKRPEEVVKALEQCWKISEFAIVENDLRAHLNPTRQVAIRNLAEKLTMRLRELCPRCQTPGWGAVDLLKGLPCEECGEFNESFPAGEIFGCALCEAKVERASGRKFISAGECMRCNP